MESSEKRTRPEALLCTNFKLRIFIQPHTDWSPTALDPLNFSANHFPSHIWGMQKTPSVKNDAMFCYCLLISQQREALATLTSPLPFILLPCSISPLTSSLVSRQEDSCTKSLMGTETKQEKFPHPSKELKIFDNVPGLAQIKEGKCQLHSGPANDCLLPSSIMLENKIAK